MPFNPDNFNNHGVAEASGAAMTVVSSVQHLPAETQVHALVAAAVVTMDALGLPISETVAKTNNLLNSAWNADSPEAWALRDYVHGELK